VLWRLTRDSLKGLAGNTSLQPSPCPALAAQPLRSPGEMLTSAQLINSIHHSLNWTGVGMNVSRLLGLSNRPMHRRYLV